MFRSLKKLGLIGIVGLSLAGAVDAKYHHWPRNAHSYEIQKGDNFSDLSNKYGITTREILEYNPDVDPRRMKIGSRIWIPEKINKNYLPSCVSEKGKEDIKKFEKFSEGPYKDPAHGDTWSIGYGHQIRPGENFIKITEEKALELFRKDIKIVEDVIRENVWVELSGKEYDALASFVYNVGVENFKNSTLLKLLNEEDYANAMDEFPKWIKSGGEVVPGLTPRRDYERSKMFFGIVERDPDYFNRLEERLDRER